VVDSRRRGIAWRRFARVSRSAAQPIAGTLD
jgi:hypothetical protein